MKLCVFDFDGTLASTPNKPQTNSEAAKVGWSGIDWWGSACSLNGEVFFHENVLKAFKEARNDPNSLAVILTGRRGVIAWRIREILRKAGMPGQRMIPESNQTALKRFKDKQNNEDQALHEEYFTGDYTTEEDYPKAQKKQTAKQGTLIYKSYIIKKLTNKDVTEVHVWEDRPEYIEPMIEVAKSLLNQWKQLKSVTIHQVFPLPNLKFPNVVEHCLKNNS